MATATLNANIDFATGSVSDDATHYSLWDALTGGNLLSDGTLANNPDPLTANQFYQIPSGDIVFTLPEGSAGLSEEMARRGVVGMVVGVIYAQMHDGAPGTNGTANILTTTRVAIQNANWTIAA